MCCYCLRCFDYVGKFFCGDICVHAGDVKRAQLYVVIYVNRFKVMDEVYRICTLKAFGSCIMCFSFFAVYIASFMPRAVSAVDCMSNWFILFM
jgi:hypothetical protein